MTLKHRIYRLLLNLKHKTYRLFCVIIVCMAGLFGLNASLNAAILRVDSTVLSCPGDGITWDTAYKYLQDALDFASNPNNNITQIWVAAADPENPYRPDQDCANPGGTNKPGLSFQMIAAVEVYGGFFGDELTLEERDIVANETVLSGEIGDPGDHDDNSNHVVSFDSLTGSPAILDGFTVSDGDNASSGGGITVDFTADAIIRNCILRDNDALIGGGLGVSNTSAGDTVEVRNCLFENNFAGEGGGIGRKGAPGDINVINSYFSANSAAFGGGVYSNTGPYTIINTTFTENSALDGGGVFFRFGVDVLFINSLFLFNTSTDDGGAVYIDGSGAAVEFINCTFSKNNAADQGGGIVARNSSTTTITNCILWGNTDGDAGTDIEEEQLLRIRPASVTVTYTCIEGLDTYSPGAGNIGDNPTFVDEDGSDSNAFDSEDNFRLYYGSPCIDAADNNAVDPDDFDVNEDTNTTEDTPDLDFNERRIDDPDTANTGNGTAPFVDMGGYEFEPCPADFDGNCKVDVKDLLFLLGAWGPNPGHPADFDGNGDVDVKDLLFLLGAWGPCACAPQSTVLSVEEEMENAGLTMADWDEFEDVMTDPESSQEDKDNYYCWMNHYLKHCTGMACTTPNCPGDAPFGHHE